MKANELSCKDLMIGDWVIFHDSGYASDGTTWKENRVCQIDSIDEDVRVKWYDESGCKEDWPHVSTVFLSPIPLTPEILEKNGFEAQDQGGGRKDVWTGFGIDCEGDIEIEFQNNIPVYLKIDGGFKGEYYTSANIKFVHELQRALRLLKTNKEMKL